MKILKLDLRSFGHFTNKTLDFSQKGKRVHVIYGHNEAGKSTTLRALQALFYGFPSTSHDDFLHPYGKLAVAAQLQLDDGSQYDLLRVKGKSKSLKDSKSNAVLAADLPAQWLGVNQELFTSMFALDHQSLSVGGASILAHKGEVGQALFGAGTGQQAWFHVLQELEEEAAQLFKARGHKQKINAACVNYEALSKEMRHSSLSAHKYQTVQRQHQRTQQVLQEFQLNYQQQRDTLFSKQRLLRLLPHVLERQKLYAAQQTFVKLPVLDTGFFQKRRDLKRNKDDLSVKYTGLQAQQQQKQQQLHDCEPQQAILNQKNSIESICHDFGVFQAKQEEKTQLRIDLQHQQRQLEQQRLNWMPQLSVAQFLQKTPDQIQVKRLEHLQQAWQDLHAEKKQLNQQRSKQQASFLLSQALLAQLMTVLTQLHTADQWEKSYREQELTQQTLAFTLKEQWQALSGGNISFDKVEHVTVPEQEAILAMDKQYQKLEHRSQTLKNQQTTSQDKLHAVLLRIHQLEQQGDVPTEKAWLMACQQRDQLWHKLFKTWCNEQAKAFFQAMQHTDQLAQALLRDVDRVRDYAQCLLERTQWQAQLETYAKEAQQWQYEQTQWQNMWQNMWSEELHLTLPPQSMLAWLDKFHLFCNDRQTYQQNALKLQSLARQINEAKQQLVALVPHLSAELSLENMLNYAKGVQEDVQQRYLEDAQQQKLQAEVEEKQRTWADKEQQWSAKWRDATENLSPHHLEVDEVPLLLEAMHQAQQQQLKIDELQQKLQQLQQDETHFITRLQQLQDLLPQYCVDPADQIRFLKKLLTEQKTQQALFHQYQQEAKDLQRNMVQLAEEKEKQNLRLQLLCTEAGGIQEEQAFAALEQKLHEKKQVEQSLVENMQRMQTDLAQDSWESIEKRCLACHPEQLAEEVHVLAAELEEKEKVLEQYREERAQAEAALNSIRAESDTASIAQDKEMVGAEIIEHVQQYQRIKLATMLLRQKIDDYRQANQGEMLTQASHFFSQLTQASFQSLHTDYNDKDQAVLMAKRANGSQVDVQGMSTGTRDQLYLALRLGYLNQRATHHQSVPFILDDILVHFDDQRSKAAMQTLVDFSQKNQVLLFSHHQHICDIASHFDEVQIHQF